MRDMGELEEKTNNIESEKEKALLLSLNSNALSSAYELILFA